MVLDPTDISVSTVAQVIQLAVAPVFLLAGIGAFLNVCAGRLSRIVDRARNIEPLLLASRGAEHARRLQEIRTLDRRMGMVSWAIFFSRWAFCDSICERTCVLATTMSS